MNPPDIFGPWTSSSSESCLRPYFCRIRPHLFLGVWLDGDGVSREVDPVGREGKGEEEVPVTVAEEGT